MNNLYMNNTYKTSSLYSVVEVMVNDKSFNGYDLVVINLNNLVVDDMEKMFSVISYTIKNGGNIIIITNNNIDDVNLNDILTNKNLWKKQHTIIYKSQIKHTNNISSGFSYIYWYSDSYRKNDPEPTYNELVENDNLISDLWSDIDSNIKLYERIIKMFTNENEYVFNPCIDDDELHITCEKLNRNYIGINYG